MAKYESLRPTIEAARADIETWPDWMKNPNEYNGVTKIRKTTRPDTEDTMTNTIPSTSDERTANNVMRHQYRVLSDDEKSAMQAIKDKGLELYNLIESLGAGRELSIAKTKTEEAVMWTIKHLTA